MKYKKSEPSIWTAPIELARRKSGNNGDQPYRGMFMRDRDRVLYSRAFRRLSGKTQVFIAGSDDHKRTRLTHTLEVSQIARTISSYLGLDCDLTEAIALGHDIGHTPFGHAGEQILHEIMSPFPKNKNTKPQETAIRMLQNEDIEKYMNLFGFKHNLQSVRAAIHFERNYGEYGLDLTNYTLWGMVHISATLEQKFRDYLNTATAVLEHKNGGI